jgi:DNA-binding transcriptional LysR family regulator
MGLGHLKVHALRYFQAVYEEGSMIRAGTRLNVVSATISGQIRALEEAYGVELFLRTTNGLVGTPAADRLYENTVPLIHLLGRIDQDLRDTSGIVSGKIRVGVMTSVCRSVIGEVIAGFREHYETVDLEIIEGLSEELGAAAEAQDLDFAVCNPPTARRTIVVSNIVADPCLIVSSRKLPKTEHIAEKLDLVAPTKRNFLRRKIDELCRTGVLRPARIIEVDGLGATLSLVRETGCCSILPEVAVRGEPESIVRFPLPAETITSDIAIVSSPDRPMSLPACLLGQHFRRAIENVQLPGAITVSESCHPPQ